jgi:hypothetical protein
MMDNQVATTFLNENIEKRFKNRDNSIIGTKTCFDSMGGKYTSYAKLWYELPCLTHLSTLTKITEWVDSIVNGLINAKQSEKPEGDEVKIRDVVVDWRMFPKVEIEGNKMHIFMRLSVHHR